MNCQQFCDPVAMRDDAEPRSNALSFPASTFFRLIQLLNGESGFDRGRMRFCPIAGFPVLKNNEGAIIL